MLVFCLATQILSAAHAQPGGNVLRSKRRITPPRGTPTDGFFQPGRLFSRSVHALSMRRPHGDLSPLTAGAVTVPSPRLFFCPPHPLPPHPSHPLPRPSRIFDNPLMAQAPLRPGVDGKEGSRPCPPFRSGPALRGSLDGFCIPPREGGFGGRPKKFPFRRYPFSLSFRIGDKNKPKFY